MNKLIKINKIKLSRYAKLIRGKYEIEGKIVGNKQSHSVFQHAFTRSSSIKKNEKLYFSIIFAIP